MMGWILFAEPTRQRVQYAGMTQGTLICYQIVLERSCSSFWCASVYYQSSHRSTSLRFLGNIAIGRVRRIPLSRNSCVLKATVSMMLSHNF
jgi:hypothetical protein